MVQVKSQSMLHHGSLGAILKQNKRKLALTLNFYYLVVLFFIVKFVFIITSTAFYGFFYGLITAYIYCLRR